MVHYVGTLSDDELGLSDAMLPNAGKAVTNGTDHTVIFDFAIIPIWLLYNTVLYFARTN